MRPAAGAAGPRLARLFRLQWEEAQQAHVLLFPEGMVRLNASAAEILRRCDGQRSVGEIVAELEQRVRGDRPGAGRRSVPCAMHAGRGWIEGTDHAAACALWLLRS